MMSEDAKRSFGQKVREARREGGWSRVAVMAWSKAVHPLVLWLQRTAPERWNPIVVAAARISRHPVVHVIGDSHTLMLAGAYPFRVTWMGAATAYNLGKEGSSTRSLEKLTKALAHVRRDNDVVLLVLGEVDSRIHVFNQFKKLSGAETIEQSSLGRSIAMGRSSSV